MRNDLGAQLEAAPAIGFPPEQLIGRGQHFSDFELARLGQPAMKNFQKQIALQIDKDWFGILVAALSAAAPQRLFGRPAVNVTRSVARGAEALDRHHEVGRDAGEIASTEFLHRHRPGAALHDHFPAAQARGMLA